METHRAVFTWVQQRLVEVGLLKGKTVAIDATTLEANAPMRSIVLRETAETYQEFPTRLARASGIETPHARIWRGWTESVRRRPRTKTGNIRGIPDAKVATMKDGRTHWAHKGEHAVEVETGAIVAVTL